MYKTVLRMCSKLKTLTWFLKRPFLYKQMLRVALKKMRKVPVYPDRDNSHLWCEGRAISTATALAKLTGGQTFSDIRQLYPLIFHEAEKAVRSSKTMGGPADLNLLYWLTESFQATRVIETGVAYGWSSLAILLSLEGRTSAFLISTDMPYPKLDNDDFVGCVVPEELLSKWKLVKRPDRDVLKKLLQEYGLFDLCHYDSDKSYEERMWAYPLLWKGLRPGGIFISDDIGDNMAFRDFCESLGKTPIVVQSQTNGSLKYVGIVQKPTE
jgi:predicted O-methyltransferase YrrM